jgi:ribosome-binding factor A
MAYRKQKLEEQIKRLVSELMIKEIKDPRIGFATLTGVDLNKDMSLARIGVSVFGDPRDLRKTIEGLNSAKNFIQHRVSKALEIRTSPRIEFYLDSSLSEGVRMVGKIEDLVARDEESAGASSPSDTEDGER